MTKTYKTPGVYINEINAFPNSVVEVATAVPAFIGYTGIAKRCDVDLTMTPTRIETMAEFEQFFGGPPRIEFVFAADDAGVVRLEPVPSSKFLLYYGMRFFFNNGGGPCWIVSVGRYVDDDGRPLSKQASHFKDGLATLEKEQEPTMLVAPDAVLLDVDGWAEFSNLCLRQCIELQSRVAIIDVYNGHRARSADDDDVISGAKAGLRMRINADELGYGMAYYPWLNTSIVEAGEVSYLNVEAESRKVFVDYLKNQWAALPETARPTDRQVSDLLGPLGVEEPPSDEAVRRAHNALLAASPAYKTVMSALLAQINVMPPAAAMAGVYTRIDTEVGVFQAPANTGIVSAVSPCVTISQDEQMDLNFPIGGKAVNAIRSFIGQGLLVWGAKTLDGNSLDWRYINVRRTMIMLEQSIKAACDGYVFAPNDSGTWLMVRNMLESFLNNQWKAGALAGAMPQEAYDVAVGLGSTMTDNDILDGLMRVTARVAVVRPAEFTLITFQQRMQTS